MTHPTNLDLVRAQLAPDGTLRAALNLSNTLLNSGRSPEGAWLGVAPDLARAIAHSLGVEVVFVPYASPGEVADAADASAWTVALIGADPVRARRIGFTGPYTEIESTYLVPPGSGLTTPAEVDQPGHTIAAFTGSAYELWLRRNLKHATLVAASSFEDSLQRCREGSLSALAGLRSKLIVDRKTWPGARVLEGTFMKVQQAVGTPIDNIAGLDYLKAFVEKAKSTGMVASWIAQHKADGLSVAAATSSQGT